MRKNAGNSALLAAARGLLDSEDYRLLLKIFNSQGVDAALGFLSVAYPAKMSAFNKIARSGWNPMLVCRI